MRFPEALRKRYAACAIIASTVLLASCSGPFDADPLVEYSTELNVQGDSPQTLVRALRAGVYLLEVRERDIDLKIGVDANGAHQDLADAYLRHGLHRTVVSLDSPASVRLTIASVDKRSWRGAAAVRILRLPKA